MNYHSEKLIFRKIREKALTIQKVCEVGVYLPETSNILDFILLGHEALLVEPEPKSIQAIQTYFKGRDNVTLLPFAIYKHNGTLTLSKAEASTFVSDLPNSPALTNDGYTINDENNIVVNCKVFSEIDPKDIDLLSVDTEGSEWHVISTMTSRPKIISIETHGKLYLNPFLKEIKEWMHTNNYKVWFKDKSDTVFYQDGVVNLNVLDKIKLMLYDWYLWFRRLKKRIFR